jgi:signal transduction histidine kinase/ActR/RegA family two-component response regulator
MDSEPQHPLVAGGGEIGALIRATDWARTPLGPIETWPRTLLSYVSLMLEMPSPAIIFWGPEQTQIYNAGYAMIMGPRHPKYLGAPYRECWPDTYPLIYPWMRRVLDQGEIIHVDKEHIPVTRYGFLEEAFFTFTFSALRDDDGAIAGIFQPVFEVTDTVLSERRAETVRALTLRGRSASDTVRDILGALSANDKDVPFALLYLAGEGGDRIELAGTTESLASANVRLQEVAEQAFSANAPVEIEIESLLDGAAVGAWPEPTRRALVLPIRRARSDAPRGVVVFGISPRCHFDDSYRSFFELAADQIAAAVARLRAQQEADWQRQQLDRLFLQAPALIAVLRGPDHVFELTNPQYQTFIGNREVRGKPFRDALPDLVDQPFADMLDNVYRFGEAHVGKEVLVRLDNAGDGHSEDAFVNFVYQPIRDETGTVEGILIFAFEVTEQVHARQRAEQLTEELRRADQLKDEFLAMLAHELRNPLAAVSNVSWLLQRQADQNGGVRPMVEILQRQTRVLMGLVDELLDVARITRGLVALKQDLVDLAQIAQNAIESVQGQMDEKHHEVIVRGLNAPLNVVGDAVRLEQVLVNVLTNAAKYTDSGGVIELSAERNGERAEIRIRDNGIGMTPEVLERAFTLFGQAERGLDRSQGGLGIGLTIAKNLIELQGGHIEAHSAGPGTGSEFVITVPLAIIEHAPRQAEAPTTQVAGRSMRVLMVEDNLDAARTLSLLLEGLGHDVVVTHDGQTALARVHDIKPELVLLDIGLPGMNGYHVAQQLRQNPDTRAAILVALTGYGEKRDRERTRAAGFDAHFVKPVDVDSLQRFVQQASMQTREVPG